MQDTCASASKDNIDGDRCLSPPIAECVHARKASSSVVILLTSLPGLWQPLACSVEPLTWVLYRTVSVIFG